jgi:hypothetical protein
MTPHAAEALLAILDILSDWCPLPPAERTLIDEFLNQLYAEIYPL